MTGVEQWFIDPWLLNILVGLATLHPLYKIFQRAGLNPWPSLLVLVPIVGFPAVGSILAFKSWPKITPRRPRAARKTR